MSSSRINKKNHSPKMQDSLFVSRRLQDICLIAAQQSREATMNKNLLNSLNRTGYKGGNVDDAMREMLGHTTSSSSSSPLLTHADVRRRAIVENYVHQTDERINENLMAREFTLQVQARDSDLIPAIQCMFIINGYECDLVAKPQEPQALVIKW